MAGRVSIGGRGSSIKGLDQLKAKLAKLPEAYERLISPALDAGADDLVENMKAIAPVSDLDPHPGAYRDSIHKEAGRHALSKLVVIDAKDAKGHGFAPHVEFGHKGPGDVHVPAEPVFYPTIRRRKKPVKSRISRAATAAFKETMS